MELSLSSIYDLLNFVTLVKFPSITFIAKALFSNISFGLELGEINFHP